MFVESRYLCVYGNTLVDFAAYFSTRSARGLSYTLLTAIENCVISFLVRGVKRDL